MTLNTGMTKWHFFQANNVILLSGQQLPDREEKINHRIGSGIGFGVKMIYYLK
jgi:hypothetical protein